MFKDLNEQQIAAIKEPGNVLLTACPGSGKTRVLAHKVAYELQFIQDSKKIIIALTFTNRAADEIKKRLIRMDIDHYKFWAGTIHSFCLEWILRPYAGYLNELKNGFDIADEYKSNETLSNLKKDKGLNWWTNISTRINKNGSLEESLYDFIVHEYHNILSSEKLIDFDQILYLTYKLLNGFPKIAQTLNNLFHLICIDEYQDTQELQYCIISKIINVSKNKTLLFIVGDKDQAIYGSLGGVAKSLEEIIAEFGNLQIIEKELFGNYRSNQRIIDYYRNFQSTDIDIVALANHANENGIIKFSNLIINKDELDIIISNLIKESIRNGVPENQICVLAPQWQLVVPMGRKLKKLLPDVNFDADGLSPLSRNKHNIWFKVARLFLVDPAPNYYLIRNRWASELIYEFESIGLFLFEGEERKAKLFLKIINSTKSDCDEGLIYLKDCFNILLQKLKLDLNSNVFLKVQWDCFFESLKNRLANPDFDYAKDIKSYKRVFMHNKGVVVNTCHGIKGEEFETVIAFGMLHGFIPNWNEAGEEAIARKILYVICSRAKNNLYLISEHGRTTRGGRPYTTTNLLERVSFTYDTFI